MRRLFLFGALVLLIHGCGSSALAPDGGTADSQVSVPDLAGAGETGPAEDRPVSFDQSLPEVGGVDAPVDSRPEAGIDAGAEVRADVGSAGAGCCCRPGSICSAFCADTTKPCCVIMIDIECLSNGGVYQTSCSVGGSCQ